MTPCLKLEGVQVAFGSLKANDDVSLVVRAGERRAIIGPNGAGKTTLFNAITGDYPPTKGRIWFYQQEITSLPPYRRARLGISRTYQITNLLAALSVTENLQLAIRGSRKRKFSLFGSSGLSAQEKDIIDTSLAACGLSHRAGEVVKMLSYGEQRQLEIAMALATSPRLLLLDEPAAGLTAAERKRIASLISELPRSLTLVMIEHDMELALGLADYVTCLAAGKVLVEDLPAQIGENQLVQEVYLGGALNA